MQISSVQVNMLKLLTVAIWDYQDDCGLKEQFTFSKEEWVEVFHEIKSQACQGFLSDLISDIDMPEAEREQAYCAAAISLKKFYSIMIEQEQLLELFLQNGIKVAVIKGAAAAIYYPQPEYRTMGDIDIVVCPEDFDRAFHLLLENNYKHKVDEHADYRHEVFITNNNIEIELHRFFSSSDNNKQNTYLDQFIFDGIKSIEKKDVAGYSVYVLPELQNGLTLLSHINHHMSSGIGLRQIIDWMMYVSQQLDDVTWNEVFCKHAEQIGMRKLAETVTLMCKKYLGLRGINWCDEADDALAEELMEYVLCKGNFGQKNDTSSNLTVFIMHRMHNPIAAVRYLAAGGSSHWTIAKKYKILMPFACFYQIGHILRKGLTRKVKPRVFLEEQKQSSKEVELLKKLGVTRI